MSIDRRTLFQGLISLPFLPFLSKKNLFAGISTRLIGFSTYRDFSVPLKMEIFEDGWTKKTTDLLSLPQAQTLNVRFKKFKDVDEKIFSKDIIWGFEPGDPTETHIIHTQEVDNIQCVL